MTLNLRVMRNLIVLLLLTACGQVVVEDIVQAETPTPVPVTSTPVVNTLPGNLDSIDVYADDEKYVIKQLLPRDGIRPIYDPEFASAESVDLNPEELVMGLAINGDVRAYPVGILRHREMVNDTVGGTPLLVTW